ncbi:hypothetical protein GDO81_004682 [Engystomops pustulosus]|uniref:Uncharacterized protein n=1 Tax=Engystomops pustulosus TaxID=76066 RepID=A0AAV7CHQ3_ENGPU|nr:hypothetical protein GDO81_004682 [Engystomops pustulosus]
MARCGQLMTPEEFTTSWATGGRPRNTETTGGAGCDSSLLANGPGRLAAQSTRTQKRVGIVNHGKRTNSIRPCSHYCMGPLTLNRHGRQILPHEITKDVVGNISCR